MINDVNVEQVDLEMAQGKFVSVNDLNDEEQREYQAWLDSVWVEEIYMDRQITKMIGGKL